MSAFDILRQYYAPDFVGESDIPAEVLEVLARHAYAGVIDGEITAAGAMAMDVYAIGKLHGEGKESV